MRSTKQFPSIDTVLRLAGLTILLLIGQVIISKMINSAVENSQSTNFPGNRTFTTFLNSGYQPPDKGGPDISEGTATR